MLKSVLLASSLMVSFPLWAATQPVEDKTASESAAAQSSTPAKAGEAVRTGGDDKPVATEARPEAAKGAGGKKAEAEQAAGKKAAGQAREKTEAPDAEPEPSPERKALLEERKKQRTLVFHLRAKRDSELNRLALGRLAASRGGDPDFNEKKNQQILKQMQDLESDYDRQIATAQVGLDEIDDRLARLDARERGKADTPAKAGVAAGKTAVGKKADEKAKAVGKTDAAGKSDAAAKNDAAAKTDAAGKADAAVKADAAARVDSAPASAADVSAGKAGSKADDKTGDKAEAKGTGQDAGRQQGQ